MASETSIRTSLSLLHRVEANDGEAWELFVRLYGPLVYSWCRNAGLQANDVEDVGQDVFRVISKKLGEFEPGRKSSGAFRSWLWGITRLQLLDHLRAICRQPAGVGGTDHDRSLQRLEQESHQPDSIVGVTSQQLVLNRAIEVVKEAVDQRTWQAFWGMAVKGQLAKDLGEELGMTSKAVRQAKFRVTKKLRDLLADDFQELVGSSTPES